MADVIHASFGSKPRPVNKADSFEGWLDNVTQGDRVDAGDFARSAIGGVPKIDARPVSLNPQRWGFASQAEMERAFGDEPDDAA